jgi:hydrogenase-4 membrane subunit HyfE
VSGTHTQLIDGLNALTAGLVLLSAFGMVTTRQVQGVIRFLVVQSLFVAASAFLIGFNRSSVDLVALGAIMIASKVITIPWVLRRMLPGEVYERREINQAVNIPSSLLLALLLAIGAEFLVGPLVATTSDPVIHVNLPIGLAGLLIGGYSLIARRDGRNEIVPIEQLASLVTEQGNPGNLRNVVRALVEVPSRRLKEGIVLVDTPGLGSLARSGAAETLAYLPGCDLALLLIDAGTTLNEEDIGTLRLLYEAGIPALVLLSKSDLLAEGDLHRAVGYIEEHVHAELGIDVHVDAVSSIAAASALLDQFFERELLPRFEQARALREASVARKIGALRESVMAALETSLDRAKREPGKSKPDTQEMETRLRVITGEIGELSTTLSHAWLEFGESPERVIDQVADMAVRWSHSESTKGIPAVQLSEWLHDVVQEFLARGIEQVRSAADRALTTLHQVAQELGSTETPSPEELERILRDAPRFEFATLPDEIHAGRWKWMGDGVLRSAIRSHLRQNVGSVLKEELHQYARALSQWSEQTLKKIEAFLSSYADAYRIQIHRLSGFSEGAKDLPGMEQDLNRLRRWRTEDGSDLVKKRA